MNNVKNKTFLFFCLTVGLLGAKVSFAQQVCEREKILPSAPDARYERMAENVVQDNSTDLQWRGCVEGQSGVNCEAGEPLQMNWAEALLHVAQVNKQRVAGYDDWRLANIRELNTLVELQCMTPAINSTLFPAAPAAHVWTSSPYHFYTHYSWYVDFASGAYTYDERTQPKLVRLVRSAF